MGASDKQNSGGKHSGMLADGVTGGEAQQQGRKQGTKSTGREETQKNKEKRQCPCHKDCDTPIELDSPHQVIRINGKEVKDSIRFKCKLSFTSQNWNFSATFYCLPLGDLQLILGMPWLHKVNPDINWKSLSI
jgi:hypothetical protein